MDVKIYIACLKRPNRIGHYILFFLLFCTTSCRKTKLDGEFSFLVGKWEWEYTVKTRDICDPFPYDSVITNSPSIDGYSYSLTFEKKGKLLVEKNGSKEDKYRLVYKTKNELPDQVIYYFYLDNKKKKLVSFILKKGRIITEDFPEGMINPDGCQSIGSVFEKEE